MVSQIMIPDPFISFKNAPTHEIRQKVIDSRIKHLEGEMMN